MIDRGQLWYHTIDLPDGSTTPGQFDTRAIAPKVPWPDGLEGGRCLDVGTFDGFWAFEMERRGAREVVAVDVDDPSDIDWAYDHRRAGPAGMRRRRSERGPGFLQAKDALGSSATRVARSVYDLDPEVDGTFDVVFLGALLLHLRDPVRALEQIRGVCSGTLVAVEAIDPALEALVPFLGAARVRPWSDQWWRTNTKGMRRLLTVAGFEVTHEGHRCVMPHGPGAPAGARQPRISGILAGRPGQRGVLLRPFIAVPRPPLDDHVELP